MYYFTLLKYLYFCHHGMPWMMYRNSYSSFRVAVIASKLKRWAELGGRTSNCIANSCGTRSSSVFSCVLFCFVVDAAVRLSVSWLWLLARSSYRESSGKRWCWKGGIFFFFFFCGSTLQLPLKMCCVSKNLRAAYMWVSTCWLTRRAVWTLALTWNSQ